MTGPLQIGSELQAFRKHYQASRMAEEDWFLLLHILMSNSFPVDALTADVESLPGRPSVPKQAINSKTPWR
jgi:hypothetical protein